MTHGAYPLREENGMNLQSLKGGLIVAQRVAGGIQFGEQRDIL